MKKIIRNQPIHYQEDGDFIVGNVLAGHEMKENDPFLFMEDVVFPEGTFGLHPHRGIETITYVLEGEVLHHDTTHGDGAIGPGDVQWMTAGKGVLHQEEPAPGTTAHVLQLWLNLPKTHKMSNSNYQTLLKKDMPIYEQEGASLTLFSGKYKELTAPTTNIVPVQMYDIHVQKNNQFTFEVEEGHKAFAIVLDGEARMNNESLKTVSPSVIHFDTQGTFISIEAIEDTHLLFYSGPQLNEPIAARGPFVMNTPEEINQAFADYRNGKFH